MKRVPPVSGVVSDASIIWTALEDYKTMTNKVVNFLDQWAAYCTWKNDPDVSEEELKYDKQSAEETLKEFEEFINQRSKENWQ